MNWDGGLFFLLIAGVCMMVAGDWLDRNAKPPKRKWGRTYTEDDHE